MAEGIEKTYPEDPHRCQAVAANGQCPNKAIFKDGEYLQFCKVHNGSHDHHRPKVYMLLRYKDRFKHFTELDQFKSLHEEIAILRLTLEELLNNIDTNELPIYVARITGIINGIRQAIETADKIDRRSGEYLGKATLLKFAGTVIDTISAEVTDPATLDRIAAAIGEAVAGASREEATGE